MAISKSLPVVVAAALAWADDWDGADDAYAAAIRAAVAELVADLTAVAESLCAELDRPQPAKRTLPAVSDTPEA